MVRRGNLTALYKYCRLWGHAGRLFKLKVRGAQPHMGTSKCQQSSLWKGESGTNMSRDQGRGFPKWPPPSHRQHSFCAGLGEAMAAVRTFPTAPIPWEELGHPATVTAPQPCLGTAPTPLSAVCWGHCRHRPPLDPAATTAPVSQALRAIHVTRVQPVPAPVWGMVAGSVGSSLSIHVLMNHLTKMQPDSVWICSEQCGFVEGMTVLCFPRQDPAAQPRCSTPARNQGSGGSPEESLG